MSYDLSFRPCDTTQALPLTKFYSYFAHRQHYHLDKEMQEVYYLNERSGAGFTFSYQAKDDGKLNLKKDPDQFVFLFICSYGIDQRNADATANEAVNEIADVCKNLSLCYQDAQLTADRSYVPFSKEKFMKSWRDSFGWSQHVKQTLSNRGEHILEPENRKPPYDFRGWVNSLFGR